TIYGSDAANGVLQIFTKKGGSDRTSVSFEATAGAETATNDYNYFERSKELLYKTGTYQKYNVAINGATGDFGYSFTGGFTDTDGVQIFDQNSNRRIDLRSGFRAKLGHEITYESSFSYVNNAY